MALGRLVSQVTKLCSEDEEKEKRVFDLVWVTWQQEDKLNRKTELTYLIHIKVVIY